MTLWRKVSGEGVEREAEQAAVTRRYDRTAWFYDLCNAPMELLGARRKRRRLLQRARGAVLEVGVGTGRNLRHYPAGVAITGLDAAPRMLTWAERHAQRLDPAATLVEGDAHALPFDDDEFDTTVGTCVLCSVADPVAAVREMDRVTRSGGQILLLEHVRPRTRLLGWFSDIATVFTRRVFGFRANRRTEENVAAAGVAIDEIRRTGIWREIVGRPNATTDGSESKEE
jgi:ubiquinone/menaquinone biosynthesis C-methylase UbiE